VERQIPRQTLFKIDQMSPVSGINGKPPTHKYTHSLESKDVEKINTTGQE